MGVAYPVMPRDGQGKHYHRRRWLLALGCRPPGVGGHGMATRRRSGPPFLSGADLSAARDAGAGKIAEVAELRETRGSFLESGTFMGRLRVFNR